MNRNTDQEVDHVSVRGRPLSDHMAHSSKLSRLTYTTVLNSMSPEWHAVTT